MAANKKMLVVAAALAAVLALAAGEREDRRKRGANHEHFLVGSHGSRGSDDAAVGLREYYGLPFRQCPVYCYK